MKRTSLVLLGLLVFACGGKDDGPVGKTDPLSQRRGVCDAWATKACSKEVQRVCGSNENRCQEAQYEFCMDMVDDEEFDVPIVKQCLNEVAAAYADAELTKEEHQLVVRMATEPCSHLTGEGSDGGDEDDLIEIGYECKGPAYGTCVAGSYCDTEKELCAALRRVGDECCEEDPAFLDGSCEVIRPCTDTAQCVDGVCKSKGKVGADGCYKDADCLPELFCSAAGEESGTCVKNAILGTGSPLCTYLGG